MRDTGTLPRVIRLTVTTPFVGASCILSFTNFPVSWNRVVSRGTVGDKEYEGYLYELGVLLGTFCPEKSGF